MTQFPNNLSEAIRWLSSFGASADGGVTRTLYSSSWKEAQEALKEWMNNCGLETNYDSIGNLFGRLPAINSSVPSILVGSHVDTVVSGGKYDGAYGIVAAVTALEFLKREYGYPRVNLEVVSLCEEEGSRFPIACSGSGMITGVYSFKDLMGVVDSDGVSLFNAMADVGFGLSEHDNIKRNIQRFIEIHIEQGPSLEKLNKTIGIVQTIVGQKRFRISVRGESNHAGTTLMKWRRDPMQGAVEMIYTLQKMVGACDDHLVATVGQFFVEPNTPNVIPSQIVFTVDVRHPLETALNDFCKHFTSKFQEIAKDKDLDIVIEKWHEVPPVQMDRELNEWVEDICQSNEVSYYHMNSGAGHDAQLFAHICPATILFVPSQGGISHSPQEYTSTSDLETGLKVLIQLLKRLAY